MISRAAGENIVTTNSYKTSLLLAMILHALMVLLVLLKSGSGTPKTFRLASSVITAVAINESQIKRPPAPLTAPKAERTATAATRSSPAQAVAKGKSAIRKRAVIKEEVQHLLQKKLLTAQAQELAALKREQQLERKRMQQKRERQLQEELAHNLLAEQQQLAANATALEQQRLQGELNEYKAKIIQAISSQWIVPEGVDPTAQGKLLIELAPGGVVLKVEILRSSGNSVLDRSAQTAILKAAPLPVPEAQELFAEFRSIQLTVRPEGVMEE